MENQTINVCQMTTEDLTALKAQIEQILAARAAETAAEHTFEFEATSDPRKGVPYVARLRWDGKENKIAREFINLARTYGRKEVTVSGNYTARDGEIIEIRTGGSWKNDYRFWYLVHAGKMIRVAHIDDTAAKSLVQKYLRGEVPAEKLLED
ncbi:MAG: hypothetical protein QMD46_12690 [Methanomicrobiales archaeon]|nr:hypothetical protein [Methanomicrobiales archaeon]